MLVRRGSRVVWGRVWDLSGGKKGTGRCCPQRAGRRSTRCWERSERRGRRRSGRAGPRQRDSGSTPKSLAIELAFRAADGGRPRVVLAGDRDFREEASSARAMGERSRKSCSSGWAITSQSVEMPGHYRRGSGDGRVAGAVARSCSSLLRGAGCAGSAGGSWRMAPLTSFRWLSARRARSRPFERRIAWRVVAGCSLPELRRVISLLADGPCCGMQESVQPVGAGPLAREHGAERSPEPVVGQRTGGRVRLAAGGTRSQRSWRIRSSPGGGARGER